MKTISDSKKNRCSTEEGQQFNLATAPRDCTQSSGTFVWVRNKPMGKSDLRTVVQVSFNVISFWWILKNIVFRLSGGSLCRFSSTTTNCFPGATIRLILDQFLGLLCSLLLPIIWVTSYTWNTVFQLCHRTTINTHYKGLLIISCILALSFRFQGWQSSFN